MNTKLIILFSALLSLSFFSCKKKGEPDLSKAFIKYFGGIEKDQAVDMELTDDGGYIIIGTTSTQGAGGSDIIVIKADNKGNEEWRKTFGGSFNDYAGGIEVTSGGYILVGTQSYKGNVFDPKQDSTKLLAIRIDNGGGVVWDSTYQYQGFFRLPQNIKIGGQGIDVDNTTDGGYVFLGTMDSLTSYDVFAIKVDASGNRTHTEDMLFGADNNDDFPTKVVAAPNGDFVYSNSTMVSGLNTFTVARFRPALGSLNNTVTNRDNESFADTSLALGGQIIDIGGDNYALVGTTYSYVGGIGSPQNIYFTKLDNNLNPIGGIQKYGSASTKEQGQAIVQTNDGGYIILGTTDDESLIGAPEKKNDLYIVKIDGNGSEEWSKTFGGIGDDVPLSIKQTSDNGFVVCATIDFGNNNDGSGKSNVIALIKLNESGELDNR